VTGADARGGAPSHWGDQLQRRLELVDTGRNIPEVNGADARGGAPVAAGAAGLLPKAAQCWRGGWPGLGGLGGLVPSLLRSVIAVRTPAGGGLLGLCSAAAGRRRGLFGAPLPPRTLVLALYAAEDAAAWSRAAPALAGRQLPVIQRRRTTAAGGGGGGGGSGIAADESGERERVARDTAPPPHYGRGRTQPCGRRGDRGSWIGTAPALLRLQWSALPH
jgi:hypothetical protein